MNTSTGNQQGLQGLKTLTKKAHDIFKDNEIGMQLFLCYCLGVVAAKINADDLAVMAESLEFRQLCQGTSGAAVKEMHHNLGLEAKQCSVAALQGGKEASRA